MKYFFALLFLTLAVVHVSESKMLRVVRAAAPPPNCQPGQTYQEDCNTCICSANGPPACTLKGCLGSNFQFSNLPSPING